MGILSGGGEESEERQMPVAESGNMLIAQAEAENSAAFSRAYWPLLTKWAGFLRDRGLDPDNQLSTDDFAGHLGDHYRLGVNYDFVKVLDFGLVKHEFGAFQTKLTAEGLATGTPAYMAPEMALGNRPVDARADVYAVGCVGYWLLTGQLVFEATTAVGMGLAHVQTPPVPPSQRTELVIPACLEEVIMACLNKNPDHRPQTVRELDRRLERCNTGEAWNAEEAERWWKTHLPEFDRPRALSTVGHDGEPC